MIHHSCSAEEPAEREADAGDADADGERDPPRGHPAGSVVRFRTIRISSWSSEQGILGLQHHDPAAVGGERDGVPHEQRREVDVGGARGRQLVLRLPRARLRQAQRPQQAVVGLVVLGSSGLQPLQGGYGAEELGRWGQVAVLEQIGAVPVTSMLLQLLVRPIGGHQHHLPLQVVVVALQLRLQPALVLPPLVRCWIHIHRIG